MGGATREHMKGGVPSDKLIKGGVPPRPRKKIVVF